MSKTILSRVTNNKIIFLSKENGSTIEMNATNFSRDFWVQSALLASGCPWDVLRALTFFSQGLLIFWYNFVPGFELFPIILMNPGTLRRLGFPQHYHSLHALPFMLPSEVFLKKASVLGDEGRGEDFAASFPCRQPMIPRRHPRWQGSVRRMC